MQKEWVINPPTPLTGGHSVAEFCSGEPTIDQWLRQRAMRNERNGSSRTYVICIETRVIAYYCLAAGSIASTMAPGNIRRNTPDPIPIMVLGRLAVDFRWQKQGLGRALLRDSILRTVQVSEIAGVKALLVHALSEGAAEFYEAHGFHRSPMTPNTLFLSLNEV